VDALDAFHPAVANWFRRAFAAPTEPQARAWPAIRAGGDVLLAAPTGSGKTLAAFLAAIDALVRLGANRGLADETRVVYVSPLKALSNDIRRNLEEPLAGIHAELAALGVPHPPIRTQVRTGDTPQAERSRMRRKPPHILVTTPESLYLLLTSEAGRCALASTRTVIVDEIHALAGNKRGAHLALSLERLESVAGCRPARIGLSATLRPIEELAAFLAGESGRDACTVLDLGHARRRDLALELPATPLEAVMSGETWAQVYDRLAELIREHRSTLVFVNTRRLAERLARALSERLGAGAVTSHHGSLARELRLEAEGRLKRGELKALVATSSLELGIDVGHVDLVCQIGSPHAISALLQRVGRSGHALGAVPKGRLFPLSRDDLVECAALLDAVRRGELDRLRISQKPLDVLAQQIAAEVACGEQDEQALYERLRRAWPYRELSREEYDAVVRMLAQGYSTRRGRRHALLHRDAVNGRLRPRAGLRMTAITCAGTIPDTADYAVVLVPEDQVIGSVNEDFAVESLAGDIFQLGNASYRILRVEAGRVRVEDAAGQPPSIPFWLGEAPARSDEVSAAVSRLRAELEPRLGGPEALAYLAGEVGLGPEAARQIVDYLGAARAALGGLPTQEQIVLERFFDESGGAQLVIHSPYGSRVNRAWGLALRKRFCRRFNFELQAAATEDAIVLSLTTVHSFALEEAVRYLHSSSARAVLVQALLDAPMFATRWRWNACIALAIARRRGAARVAPQLQRMEAEDLLAAIFPDPIACRENLPGEREIPDHPLVAQTLADCLHEAMDVAGLERLLHRIETGTVRVTARDLVEPSPFALEILAARPYAFLDEAPLEERRARAVASRRWLDPQSAADIGQLDAAALARVKEEAWPQAGSAEELHDALLGLGLLTEEEVSAHPAWEQWLHELARARRAARLVLDSTGAGFWVAAERLPEFCALHPGARPDPPIAAPPEFAARRWTREEALVAIVRGRLEGLGPVCAEALACALCVPVAQVQAALAALEAEGFVLRGRFTPGQEQEEWCERRLLARIHHYTMAHLRKAIEPVSAADFMRFLFDWQRVSAAERMSGPDALAVVVSQLEGYRAAAAAWETALLPARVAGYDPAWLDALCLAGRVVWMRLDAPRPGAEPTPGPVPVRATPIALAARRNLPLWTALAGRAAAPPALSSRARAVADYLARCGASFFEDIAAGLDLPPTFVEDALRELVAAGLVSSDSFSGLRALLLPAQRRKPVAAARRRRTALFGVEDAGRWALLQRSAAAGAPEAPAPEAVELAARTLLRRYGVVFWRLVARETDWLPPWRELLPVFRRLEARGEVRGGRFVAGFSGEQFALHEAVGVLRAVRSRERNAEPIVVSAADPLNLVGLLLPGPRVPALHGNRVLYRDGMAIAALVGGALQCFETVAPGEAWEIRDRLLRSPAPRALAALG
jgi:ATP-dependent Lhr-like helicase